MTKDTNDRKIEIIKAVTRDVDAAINKCREALAKECGMTLEEGTVAAFREAVLFLKALRKAFADKVDLTTGKRTG